MEIEEVKEEKVSKKTVKKKGALSKKLDPDSLRLLQSLKDQANKKNFGRNVRDSEIIAVALKLVTAEQIAKLQEQTLTERDRLNIAHEEYQKLHGKTTLDQFIGKLLQDSKSVQKVK